MNRAASRPPTKETYRGLHTAALTGLLSLAFINPTVAADFPGDLKGATITDAQATNKPPVAAFTYAIDGNTVTFNGNDSSDPDGNITKYKWTFDDGNHAEGVTAARALPEGAKLNVTLIVEDNSNGIALKQQTISLTTEKIHDDFSKDTTTNYTVMSGKALSIYDDALHTGSWSTTVAFHNTSLEKNDHIIEADVIYSPENGSGLMVRCDPKQQTGYLIFFEYGRVCLNTYEKGTKKWIKHFDGHYNSGTYHLRIEINGDIITVAVNGSVVLTNKDNTITSGSHAGIFFRTGPDEKYIFLDNFVSK